MAAFSLIFNSLSIKSSNIQLILPSLNHYSNYLTFWLFCYYVGNYIARIVLEEFAFESHINIDSCGRCGGMSEQLFDDLYLHTLLDQKAAAGVSEGVSCDAFVINPYRTQPLLDDV